VASTNDIVVIYSSAAPDTGTYTFTIGQDLLSSGVVEARINAGAWGTVIATSTLTGTLAGVTVGDTVEFRCTQTGTDLLTTLLLIEPPIASTDAYSILVV